MYSLRPFLGALEMSDGDFAACEVSGEGRTDREARTFHERAPNHLRRVRRLASSRGMADKLGGVVEWYQSMNAATYFLPMDTEGA